MLAMPGFRLYPAPEQVVGLAGHCGHVRFVWNPLCRTAGLV